MTSRKMDRVKDIGADPVHLTVFTTVFMERTIVGLGRIFHGKK